MTAKERKFYAVIEPKLKEVLAANNIEDTYLSLKVNIGFVTISYRTSKVFSFKIGKKIIWEKFSMRYLDLLPEDMGTVRKIKDGEIRIDFSSAEALEEHVDIYAAILDKVIDNSPKSMSCCSRYMQCSQEEHCVNPHKELAMDCRYKTNLKHGRNYFKSAAANTQIDLGIEA